MLKENFCNTLSIWEYFSTMSEDTLYNQKWKNITINNLLLKKHFLKASALGRIEVPKGEAKIQEGAANMDISLNEWMLYNLMTDDFCVFHVGA